jgi:3'-phosphoadenosine 5'-phosphosulfate sulfotransferase (PAPS reductase)/FAD synthetase
MYLELCEIVPIEQRVVVHADLQEVDWHGTIEHIRNTILPEEKFVIVKAGKTFWDMVDRRQNWPSPQYRQCTSDLKVGPIDKFIRHHIKDNGLNGKVINAMGIRAEESSNRAKKNPWKFSTKNSRAGRQWYDWNPIFKHSVYDVFKVIKDADQVPHWAYLKGMTRLSCCFCIMSNKRDLRIARKHNPDMFNQYLLKEMELGKTVFYDKGPIFMNNYLDKPYKNKRYDEEFMKAIQLFDLPEDFEGIVNG